MNPRRLDLTVNGVRHSVTADAADTLLDVLRRELSVFSCRETCGIGVCGACTVLLNGRAVSACLLLALAHPEARIRTAEGLAAGGRLSRVQQAFVDAQAFQCSFCTPGFLMSVTAMLEQPPEERSAEATLSGHLCRCGSYRQIHAAVRALLDADDDEQGEQTVPTERFSRELTVAADAERAWKVLTDVQTLAGWVGIVHDVREIGRLEKYAAVLQDKVGPLKLRADLDITATVVEDGRHIEIQASGRDRAVDSRIAVSAALRLDDAANGGTTVAVAGDYQVTGRVAGMGGGVIRKKADRIISDFFTKAGEELGGDQ